MADNTSLNAGTGGDTIATDDIGGVKYQRIKLSLGADGTTTGDVSDANPLPVVNSAAVTVTGSVGVSGPVTVTGTVAATQSGSWGIAGPVTVTGSVSAVGQVSVVGAVAISGPVTVTGSVTSAISGPVTVTGTVAATQSGAWSISATSNLANLLGASVNPDTTVVGTVGIARRVDDASATVSSTVGGAVALQVDAFGNLRVNNAATTVATISGPMTVTGSVGISGPVTVTGTVAATQSGTFSVIGAVGISGPVTVTGSVGISGPVTVTGTVAATQSGSWVIAGPVTVVGNVTSVGAVAHGAAASGNPVLVGIEGRSTDQAAVDSGDVTRALATLLGKLVSLPYAIPANTWKYAMATAGLATTVASTALASAGANTRYYLTGAQVINQGAAVTRVLLQDGAGSIYWNVSAATSGGGVSASFPVPIRWAANQTVEIKNDTTGTTTFVNLQGYTAAE